MMMMMIPIVVTLVGIVTDVSAVHEEKAQSPNDSFNNNNNNNDDDDDDDVNDNNGGTDRYDTSRNSN